MRRSLLVAILCLTASRMSVVVANANDARRHPQQRSKTRLYQDFDWKGNPEEILKRQIRNVAIWKKVLEILNDPNRNFAGIDPKNLPDIKFDESTINSLKKLVQSIKSDTKLSAKKIEEFRNALQKAQTKKNNQGGATIDTKGESWQVRLPPTRSKSTQERFTEWLEDFAADIGDSEFGRELQKTAAWRATIEEFQSAILNPDGKKGGEDWQNLDWLPTLDNVDIGWLENGLERFDNISPPSLPDIDIPSPRFSKMPVPSFGVGGQSSGWTFFQFVMWTVFAVVVAILLWQVARKRKFPTAPAEGTAWRLGPWPIHPSQITTQAEFIKAFDYLAVLLLGRQVCTDNHREISKKLSAASSASPEKKSAVKNLVARYEHARYAPTEQPITAEARREMLLVAGMNAS